MYRVSEGNAKEVGSYVSTTPQGDGLQSQLDGLSIQHGEILQKM